MFARYLTPLSLAAWAATTAISPVSCNPTYRQPIFARTPAQGIDLTTLIPQLSPAAQVYLPGSSEFATSTIRWSNLEPPTPNVVIAPGTEQDVAQIVSKLIPEYSTAKNLHLTMLV
jgi:hypothetical protein